MGYGLPEEVRAEVVRVLGASLPELGLRRTPALRVRVRREPGRRTPETEVPEAADVPTVAGRPAAAAPWPTDVDRDGAEDGTQDGPRNSGEA